MSADAQKKAIAKQLQSRINAIQGLGKRLEESVQTGFSPFAEAFPDAIFPQGVVHEFISYERADAASTNGFITALAGKFLKEGGLCIWVSTEKNVFPLGLSLFGLPPDRIVFVCPRNAREALWIIEEALKCESLTAVIAQIRELGFTESRRLQLAVERSGVTGFIHRFQPFSENAVACTTRWRITPLPSQTEQGLPGIGHAHWQVELLKVKNGKPYSWQISWLKGQFVQSPSAQLYALPPRHAG